MVEDPKKTAIQEQISRVRSIHEDITKAKAITDKPQLLKAQQNNEKQIKEELLKKNDLVAKNAQRSEQVKNTKNHEKLETMLLVATAYDVKRQKDEEIEELLEAKKHRPELLKQSDDTEDEEEEEKENEEEEDTKKDTPGQRLNQFFALMGEGFKSGTEQLNELLSTKLKINELSLKSGRLDVGDKKMSLTGDEYVKKLLDDQNVKKMLQPNSPPRLVRKATSAGQSEEKEERKTKIRSPFALPENKPIK